MESRILIVLTVFFSILTVSCRNPGMYVRVFSGNYAYSRGDYQDANLMYINAGTAGKYEDYISYNLGNVYYALGESSSALKKWDISMRSLSKEVEFSSFYNRGVLLFELSRYEEAYDSFKRALELDSADINAKIDLEYCLLKMSTGSTGSSKAAVVKNTIKKDKKDDAMRILDFVKRFEENSLSPYKKGGDIPSEGEVNDW